MIVCPLCEHPQPAGDTCDVCGRRLEGLAGEVPRVPPLEGLEPTHHPAAAVPDPTLWPGRLEGLEPTRAEPDAPGVVEPLLDLEPTRAAPVEVEGSTFPDLEPTAAGIPGDGPTPLPASPTCRYCRTAARPGERRCARCGMRLPLAIPPAAEGGAAAVRRCACGAPVTGAVCPACGGRIPGALDG